MVPFNWPLVVLHIIKYVHSYIYIYIFLRSKWYAHVCQPWFIAGGPGKRFLHCFKPVFWFDRFPGFLRWPKSKTVDSAATLDCSAVDCIALWRPIIAFDWADELFNYAVQLNWTIVELFNWIVRFHDRSESE